MLRRATRPAVIGSYSRVDRFGRGLWWAVQKGNRWFGRSGNGFQLRLLVLVSNIWTLLLLVWAFGGRLFLALCNHSNQFLMDTKSLQYENLCKTHLQTFKIVVIN